MMTTKIKCAMAGKGEGDQAESLWDCACAECGDLRADLGCEACHAEEATWDAKLAETIVEHGLLGLEPRALCDGCRDDAWDCVRASLEV